MKQTRHHNAACEIETLSSNSNFNVPVRGPQKRLFTHSHTNTQHILSYNCALTCTHDNRTFVNLLRRLLLHLLLRCCTTTQPINTPTPHVIGRLQPFYLSSNGGSSQSAELGAERGHMSHLRSLFVPRPSPLPSPPLPFPHPHQLSPPRVKIRVAEGGTKTKRLVGPPLVTSLLPRRTLLLKGQCNIIVVVSDARKLACMDDVLELDKCV